MQLIGNLRLRKKEHNIGILLTNYIIRSACDNKILGLFYEMMYIYSVFWQFNTILVDFRKYNPFERILGCFMSSSS